VSANLDSSLIADAFGDLAIDFAPNCKGGGLDLRVGGKNARKANAIPLYLALASSDPSDLGLIERGAILSSAQQILLFAAAWFANAIFPPLYIRIPLFDRISATLPFKGPCTLPS
jgi:hypothetical protein